MTKADLQSGVTLYFENKHGVWSTNYKDKRFQGTSPQQVVEMVRQFEPTIDLNITDIKHHQHVFQPKKFPLGK